MARILFTLQPGAGHLHPLVPLTAALRAAGHDVRIATARRFGPAVEASGLPAVVAGRDWLESRVEETFPGFLTRSSSEQLEIFAGQAAPALAADVVALARIWRPALVVRDNTEWGGWVAAEEIGVPSVVYGVINRNRPPALRAVVGPQLAALRAARRLPPDPELATLEGACFLDTTPPSLDLVPTAPAAPGVVRVRPVFADAGPEAALPPWLAADDTRPLVFATLGTVFHRHGLLVGKLLAAVADEDYRVLLALGDGTPPSDPLPGNVRVERYVPLSQTLPRCAAVLCHGGRGTTLTALGQGVPVCALPLSADQPIVARVVERSGAGLCASTGAVQLGPFACPHTDPALLDPLDLRRQLRRLLAEPAFGERARAVQAEIAALPGPERVAAMLEGVLAGRAAGSMALA